MFRAKKLELDEPRPYIMVNRCYPAFEGEGISIGQAKWFFRTQGCSVGCVWCDSRPTWRFDLPLAKWPEENHAMFELHEEDFDDFVKELLERNPSIRHISLTGGEPLQQNPEILPKFVETLHNHHFTVQLETSGQICGDSDLKLIKSIAEHGGLISVDLKTPSAKLKCNDLALELILKTLHPFGYRSKQGRPVVQVKAVNMINDNIDYEFIKEHYNNWHEMGFDNVEYIITPCWTPGKDANISAEWLEHLLNDNSWLRKPKVILQQHKVVYGTDHQDS
jgi:7-carboxy-7-deazaguanine synthase